MSRSMNNFTPFPGPWQRSFRSYDGHPFSNLESSEVPVIYRPRSTHTNDDRNSGLSAQQRFWDFMTPIGFHNIPDFPAPPPRRQHIHVHSGDRGRPREIFLQPPSRSTFQASSQVPPAVEIPKSTVLSKLKKVVYDPPPRQYARRVGLYYRNNASNSFKEKEREKDEDGKRCAICLEDFEANEEVMLTPCKHMFHEDCIVPWLTNKGQCPVCRSVIWERGRENPSSFNRNHIANLAPNNLIHAELLSILRTMEDAFPFDSMTYY
ncbi:uncharacterized protein LOC113858843 [Abrus precatorius]|uniref:Uncharacterized protein LOC113858843 n=1 Tax=Abrus precatorius TaxID=3816 RepID=A0A8B8KVQ7_ABRPR|nr:uncharacterized protein LOC113858843 [Abrus precatorius]